VFDRMESNILPTYTIMTQQDIVLMETKHMCTKSNWPILRCDDPLSLYLGLQKDMCVFVRDRMGIVNIRHVV
jgi:hypothetical protein